jgi:arsenate reductase
LIEKIKTATVKLGQKNSYLGPKRGESMQLYGLKTCDTCRKALKSLKDVEFIDVRADGVPVEVLVAALGVFGADLVNTRSTTWRGLDDAARAASAEELLRAYPALMKRPLIVDGNQMYLGWGADVQSDLGVS